MTISINDPQLQEFVDRQVEAGAYVSVTQMVEAALARLMLDDINDPLTEDELTAIDESERQIEAGEFLDWKDVSRELRRKYLGK